MIRIAQRRWTAARLLFPALIVLAGCVAVEPPSATAPSAPVKVSDAGGEQILIPSPQAGVEMHATVYRPAGAGPFPLAVINHGSDQEAARRARMPPPNFPALTSWFLEHGYVVVLPVRPGHGATGGRYIEDQGSCWGADYEKSGYGTADSIQATIDTMRKQPFVRQDGTVVVGHSAGGWGGLALAARNPAGVRAVINLSGGRGGRRYDKPNDNCAPDRLVAAAGAFGRRARIPSLWLYAENDTYLPPALSRAMASAFEAGGAPADYHLYPALPGDGHFLAQTTDWTKQLQDFLARHP